jgi:PHD/YefM family antitoxin component YafN of YafNO toxin-antitoxin module
MEEIEMITIHKKIVVGVYGKPTEVIIPWDEYKEIEELLGLDLDEQAINDLKHAQKDRTKGKKDVYLDLDSI